MPDTAGERRKPKGLPFLVRFWQFLLLANAVLTGLGVYLIFVADPGGFGGILQTTFLLIVLTPVLAVMIVLLQRYTSLLAYAVCFGGGMGLAWYAMMARPHSNLVQGLSAAGEAVLGLFSFILLLAFSARIRFSVAASRVFICLFLILTGMILYSYWHWEQKALLYVADVLGASAEALYLRRWDDLALIWPLSPDLTVVVGLFAGIVINTLYYIYFTLSGARLHRSFLNGARRSGPAAPDRAVS